MKEILGISTLRPSIVKTTERKLMRFEIVKVYLPNILLWGFSELHTQNLNRFREKPVFEQKTGFEPV
jgi:hypothetical protein